MRMQTPTPQSDNIMSTDKSADIKSWGKILSRLVVIHK